MPKKCPACNSTRYKKIKNNFKCARCNFVNKPSKNINKELDNQLY